MKPDFKIYNYGICNPKFIVCFNWKQLNNVSLVRTNDEGFPNRYSSVIAIFKVKYKN